MQRKLTTLILVISALSLGACATAAGTAVGAGIGSLSGDTRNGALIGGTVGLMSDVFF